MKSIMSGINKGKYYICNNCDQSWCEVVAKNATTETTEKYPLDADDMTHEEMEAIANNQYPQDEEEDEFRYLSPTWLNEIARGLTAGAKRHPDETWRTIPAKEHAWRAVRHLIKYLQGDKQDNHLIHAAMRVMMAFETDKAENDVIDWERLGREKGVM